MLDATPLLRLFSALRLRRLERQDPAETQKRQLLHLIRRGQKTAFGRDHSLDRVRSVEDFQAAIPLRTYEDFWQGYWVERFPDLSDATWPGRTPFFALTSGTTQGTTKHIPCTEDMIRSNARAGMDLLAFHALNRPRSRLLTGKNLVLGGSTDLQVLGPGILAGDLSGIEMKAMPWWIRPWTFPPLPLALMKNWEEKIDALVETAPRERIRSVSGVPSWLMIFFNKLFERHRIASGRLKDVFPHLEMVVHGGVHFEPYQDRFQKLLEGSGAETREVYPASEGFVAVADRGPEQGLRLLLDHGIFYEFVPLEEIGSPRPTRHWVGTLVPDLHYAVVLTTCAGLWGYILGDTVRFVETRPPRLQVSGRTDQMLSAFGEHLIEQEIEHAVSEAARRLGLNVVDFTMGAVLPQGLDRVGHHRMILEFAQGPVPEELTERLAVSVDELLKSRNDDYAAHRQDGYGLGRPEILVVPPGFFRAWLQRRGQLGGQHKVPRIMTSRELFEGISSLASRGSI